MLPMPSDEAAVRRAGTAVFPGFRLRRVARTPSTQDLVRAAARRGAAEGYCCAAGEQSAGRGRDGRSWVAPPGSALLVSLLLRRTSAVASAVPLAAGLAVADAVEGVSGVACGLRWPNDVMARGRKLAGVLAETAGGACVLGIGVNLAVPGFPPGLAGVSLHELAGRPVPWSAMLAELLPHLGRRLAQLEEGGVPALRGDWTERALGLGEPVAASDGARTVTGVAVGLDDDGALLLQRDDAGRLRLVAGDVHMLR